MPSGIIPARAGFTGQEHGRPPRARDHPRSRGVYRVLRAVDPPNSGSSPLARGLRPVYPERGPVCPDHPRSRGVYRNHHLAKPSVWGSSPLARGLRHAPSSRASDFAGSSPLARGLPRPVVESIRFRRIIPARAGFTGGGRGVDPAGQDHPRSRGVYYVGAGVWAGVAGSSPLARGLRVLVLCFVRAFGIIPARAGFTLAAFYACADLADHPRSRGVYCVRSFRVFVFVGSSPLARGLHHLRKGS